MRRKIKKTKQIFDELYINGLNRRYNDYLKKQNKYEIGLITKAINLSGNDKDYFWYLCSIAENLIEHKERINYRNKNVVNVTFKILYKYELRMQKESRIFSKQYLKIKKELYKELRKILKMRSLKISNKTRKKLINQFTWTKDVEQYTAESLRIISIFEARRAKKFKAVFSSKLVKAAVVMTSSVMLEKLIHGQVKQLRQKVG